VLRIRFTAEDLLRVRFAAGPAPLLELGLAVSTLRRDDAVFARWVRRVRLPRAAQPLLQVIPPSAGGPMFVDPVSEGFADGLERVLSAPHDHVRAELARACRPTPWTKGLMTRDRDAWRTLEGALGAAYRALIGPEWARIRASFHADLAWRRTLLAQDGLGATLAGIFPGSGWNGTTLEVDAPWDGERGLDGRGLTLMPSAFWRGSARTQAHPDGSLMLVYPALTPVPLVEDGTGEALDVLLGRTRAAVLSVLTEPRTTTELARTLKISLSSASEHAGALRHARLVVTRRAGKAVTHEVTPLGLRLLTTA
jgi:DNA-binding transcriptional ArsR family regulator